MVECRCTCCFKAKLMTSRIAFSGTTSAQNSIRLWSTHCRHFGWDEDRYQREPKAVAELAHAAMATFDSIGGVQVTAMAKDHERPASEAVEQQSFQVLQASRP